MSVVVDLESTGRDAYGSSVECPVCSTATNRSLPAHIAPFIAERAGLDFKSARSYFCSDCDHVFAYPFYTRDQISRIYMGYRDDSYNASRDRHEPGYASSARVLADLTGPAYKIRRDFYNYFLASFSEFRGLVVDYGGGDGYFSRFIFKNAEVVVADEDYERSGGDLPALMGRADFLFATHVFEHLPEPLQALRRLTSWLRPGAPVYIKLPKTHNGRLRSAFAELERQYELGQDLPWTDILIVHEHIGHFSKSSAARLLDRGGVNCEEYYFDGAGNMGFLGHRR